MMGSSGVCRALCPGLPERRARTWRTTIRPPTASIRSENAASSTGSGTWAEVLAPTTAPPTATSPNATPRPRSTLPALRAVTAPSSEVTPTTTSDPVVACTGLCPSA